MEITLSWGGSVLHVAHVPFGGSFVLGEFSDVDFSVGRDVLGVGRLILLSDGQVCVPTGTPTSWQRAALETFVEFERGAIRIRLERVRRAPVIGRTNPTGPWAYVGGALALAGVLLLQMSLVPPQSAAFSVRSLDRESQLEATLLPSKPPEPAGPVATQGDRSHGPRDTTRRSEPSRAASDARTTHRSRNRPVLVARPAVEDAGALGPLHAFAGRWRTSSPFSLATSIGPTPLGSLTGSIGDSFGFGGLHLNSMGRGTGGDGSGVVVFGGGSGRGTICDVCPYGALGVGSGTGRASRREPRLSELRERTPRVPTIRCDCAALEHVGAVSRDVIQRVVRRHHNEVVYCYQKGLEQRPELRGRVTTRFLITPEGAVSSARIQASTLGHAETEECIRRATARWSFPVVDGGVTVVTYPFTLESR